MTSNLKSMAEQVEEIRSLITNAQETLDQATYALNTLIDRLEREENHERG